MKSRTLFKSVVFFERGGRFSRWTRLFLVGVLLSTSMEALALPVVDGPGVSPVRTPSVKDGPAVIKSVSYKDNAVQVITDRPVTGRVFSLRSPDRVVIDLAQTIHGPKVREVVVERSSLKKIRSSQWTGAPDFTTRVVLDMAQAVPYRTEFTQGGMVLRFTDGGSMAEAPASEPHSSATGFLTEEVSAAAEDRVVRSSKSNRRDLLNSLPKNPVTIDFDEADIRDVIRVLSEMSGINMIFSSDLRATVTIHLDQVPFNEIFDTVLATQGLVAQQMGGNILRILTPESLNNDRARSVTNYRTFILNYGRASEISPHLAAVRISPSAKVTVDERNNALVITDTPEGLAAAERLIAELDRKPPQVLIETKIVQIDLSKALDLGIQWDYSKINEGSNPYNRSIIGQREVKEGDVIDAGKVGFPMVAQNLEGEWTQYIESPASTVGQRGTGVSLPGKPESGITFGFINSTEILTATLNALETEGQTKTLTNPKVITTNNQEAKIQIGSKVPFSTTTVGSSGVSTQSITFVDVGFIIRVTPTINVDNRIRLKVVPEVSEVADTSVSPPTINTTTADTEVMIKDGETLVIGGLVSEKMIESAKKVPLLGDLPVLGVFFRSTSETKKRLEIIIFVTARVVPD